MGESTTQCAPGAEGSRQPEASLPLSGRTALVLSAGAPHSPLMAGALCAFVEEKIKLDIVYTSGAGALIGLLLVAPKDKSPTEALKGLLELGISDLIYYHLPFYRLLPINYKAFMKPGRFTEPIQRFARNFKVRTFESARAPKTRPDEQPQGFREQVETAIDVAVEAIETSVERRADKFIRLYNDLVDLWAAAIAPIPPPSYWSQGLCAPLPFLEDLVDFSKLDNFKGEFYVNAFSPEKARESNQESGKSGTGSGMKLFGKREIGPDQVRAAFAYPFIYAPVKIEGRLYFEGANRDPISFGHLMHDVIELFDSTGKPQKSGKNVGTIVLVDILGSLSQYLLREPRNLWDAFGLSILVPAVAHAQNEVARFKRHLDGMRELEIETPAFLKVPFDVPQKVGHYIVDWSYSNMSALFDIGLDAGRKFLRTGEGQRLPRS